MGVFECGGGGGGGVVGVFECGGGGKTNITLMCAKCENVFSSSAEEAMKARREIADYIKNKRTERARIRVG